MFQAKLKISSNLDPGAVHLISSAWRTLLATVSILVVTIYLLWILYQSVLDARTSQIPKNLYLEDVDVEWISNYSLSQRIVNGCQIESCSSIACSSISKEDPGTVASNFIETVFKVFEMQTIFSNVLLRQKYFVQATCKHADTVKLSFSNCKFPENKLRTNWLGTNLSIAELIFKSSFIEDIEDEVFSSIVYENTKRISFMGNKLNSLRSGMFHGLKSLTDLIIQENTINQAEFDLLACLADSLASLDLSGSINNRQTLRNITGGNVPLSKLLILTIRWSNIPTIDRELFTSVPSVKSLYLEYSKIEYVARDTFEPMSRSIEQLMLSDNNIVSLPQGVFDSIIQSNQMFHVAACNNPWHCDCSLKWMKDIMESIMSGIPSCETPVINAGKLFTEADFCYQSNATSSTASIKTTSTEHSWSSTTTLITDPPKDIINVSCDVATTFLQKTIGSRKLMSNEVIQIRSRFPHFNVTRHLDQGILINLPSLEKGVTLLWFDNYDANSLRCVKNVKDSYLVRNIDPQTTYTVCLLTDNEDTTSPLNCLAVITSPRYEDEIWLRNADKGAIYGISVSFWMLLFFVGAFVMFLLIRRHPTLLRGSKRVMLVKRRNLDAIVLPRGVDIEEGKEVIPIKRYKQLRAQKPHEDGYITPLPPVPVSRGSRVSKISVQSDGMSYVSLGDPTDAQSVCWKTTGSNNESEGQKSRAPPLPPRNKNAVPSLSLTIDSNGEDIGYYAPNA